MIIEKIEPSLLKVFANDVCVKKINCIIYANNYLSLIKNIKKNNFEIVERFPFINAVCVKISGENLANISSNNSVKYIASTTKVASCVNVAKRIVGCDKLFQKNTSNFSIAVIDTGIYPHLDFVLGRNKIRAFHDVINGRLKPYDDNGHGTFVAGLICSSGLVSSGKYAGIDPNIDIVSVKALDENGETNSINILKAMQWIYDNRLNYNIKIVCMSFGSVVLNSNDPLIQGAESLWSAGIVVCSAGGNSGPDESSVKSPGASSKIITVGAMDDCRTNGEFNSKNFSVAEFSSRGPILNHFKPDCVVSGVEVVSACNYFINKKFYSSMSGTSVSTPIVAGVCSHILKKYKSYQPNQVKKYILNHCNKISGERNKEGFGWLNINNFK